MKQLSLQYPLKMNCCLMNYFSSCSTNCCFVRMNCCSYLILMKTRNSMMTKTLMKSLKMNFFVPQLSVQPLSVLLPSLLLRASVLLQSVSVFLLRHALLLPHALSDVLSFLLSLIHISEPTRP